MLPRQMACFPIPTHVESPFTSKFSLDKLCCAELIKQPSLWGNAMARLSAAEVTELQTIGASTRTLEGTATSEPCWSWALYGGGTPRDPVDLFAIANVDNL